MALLSEALREKQVDVRMVQRAFSKGLIGQAEIDKNIKNLADDGENADFINLETLREGVDGQSGLRD